MKPIIIFHGECWDGFGGGYAAWKKFGTNPRGHVVLQDHGDEVWYRNVRIKSLDNESKSK